MKKFLRLLVLIHCLVYLPLKEFQFIFVVNYVPVLFLAEQRFEIIDLFLESFLVKVNVLVHFSLSLPKHVRDKLLYPSHHYLRFYPEIILFSLNGLLLLLVKSNQIFIFLFDGAKKGLSVLGYRQDLFFVHSRVLHQHGIISLDAVGVVLSITIIDIIIPRLLLDLFQALVANGCVV